MRALVLLLFENRENSRVLRALLKPHYDIVETEDRGAIGIPFDLAIVDGPILDQMGESLRLRRAGESPVFLPVLLVTPRLELERAFATILESVDDYIVSPVEAMTLLVRVELLLKARRMSLQLKERNEDLEAFVHAMAHDLKAPARASAAFAQLLLHEMGSTVAPESRQYLDRIVTASEQMYHLIENLLSFSRLGRKGVRPRSVELGPLVRGVLANMEANHLERGAEVGVAEHLPLVWADPFLLEVALTNLISNAVKFVAPGKRASVEICASVQHGFCRIEVRDNGIGIPHEHIMRVFSPFVRLHGSDEYQGTGLGLASVRKVVELMEGRVGACSIPGEGSVFWIDLPVKEQDPLKGE